MKTDYNKKGVNYETVQKVCGFMGTAIYLVEIVNLIMKNLKINSNSVMHPQFMLLRTMQVQTLFSI